MDWRRRQEQFSVPLGGQQMALMSTLIQEIREPGFSSLLKVGLASTAHHSGIVT